MNKYRLNLLWCLLFGIKSQLCHFIKGDKIFLFEGKFTFTLTFILILRYVIICNIVLLKPKIDVLIFEGYQIDTSEVLY